MMGRRYRDRQDRSPPMRCVLLNLLCSEYEYGTTNLKVVRQLRLKAALGEPLVQACKYVHVEDSLQRRNLPVSK